MKSSPLSAASTSFKFRANGLGLLALGLLLAGLSGCASPKVAIGPVFFPVAPNPPRIQYLMKVSDSQDIEGKKSSFSLFAKSLESDRVLGIGKPYGVTVVKGKIYLCDEGSARVFIIDPVKKTFEPLKGNLGPGKLSKPLNIALDENGYMYVADIMRKEILIYDAAGNFKAALGKDLEMKPVDLSVSGDYLYVVDVGHSEIKVLDKTGKLVNQIGKGSEGKEGLGLPTNSAMDDKGYIYVTNTLNGKVMKYDRDGHVINAFGKFGDGFGEFGRPRGIAVDDMGRIYVVDAAHQNVQIFNEKFRILMFFGDPNSAADGTLNLPAGIAVSTDNLPYYQSLADPSFVVESIIFVTNQYGPNKLSIYGMGHARGAADDTKASNAAEIGDAAKKEQLEKEKLKGTVKAPEKK